MIILSLITYHMFYYVPANNWREVRTRFQDREIRYWWDERTSWTLQKGIRYQVHIRCSVFFYQLRKQIFRLYPSVFDTDYLDLDEDKAVLEAQEDDMVPTFQKTFGWFVVINRITGNDFTKHEYIYKKKITEVLNQLTFLIEYDKEQLRIQKEQMKTR